MYFGSMSRLKPAALEEEEEALGVIWHNHELGQCHEEQIRTVLSQGISPDVFERLLSKDLARLSSGNVELSESGRTLAQDVTRRHRLAERLLVDLLDVGAGQIDEDACRWEHILSPEATRAICTLLGHPRHCPHGTPIPPGECCKQWLDQADPVITSLDKLLPGNSGKIVYLAMEDKPVIQKLLALGLTPGSLVTLKQSRPSIVVQTGETVIALEQELAQRISVKKVF